MLRVRVNVRVRVRVRVRFRVRVGVRVRWGERDPGIRDHDLYYQTTVGLVTLNP
jgi:hypothetical protein